MMKFAIIGIGCGIGLIFVMNFILWLQFDYFPGKTEIDRPYQYSRIKTLMESEDVEHYWPTLNKAMEDGKIQNSEYDQLMEIEDNLSLILHKAAFLALWTSKKEQWKEDFSSS